MSTSPETAGTPVTVTSAVFAPLPGARREVDVRPAGDSARTGAAGYAAGWAQGVAAAAANERAALAAHAAAAQAQRAAAAAALEQALSALDDAAEQMRRRLAPVIDATADVLVAAAADLAEVVVGHELADAEHRGRRALARALAAAPEHEDVLVALHPDDLALLAELPAAGTTPGGRGVRLTADPGLQPGDALAHFPGGLVDARVSTALARLRGSLRSGGRS